MSEPVSKSNFKERALDYLREVETTGEELIITDHGKPVLKLVRYNPDPQTALEALRGSVIRYDDPTEPVGQDWGSLR
jgi:prevent-host-death family protein